MASADAKAQLAAFTDQGLTEPVIYRPRVGRPRTITAIVDRGGPEGYAGAGAAVAITVTVLNDEIEGIDVNEIDRGGDKLAVAELRGDPAGDAPEREIHRISNQDDHEFVQVELR